MRVPSIFKIGILLGIVVAAPLYASAQATPDTRHPPVCQVLTRWQSDKDQIQITSGSAVNSVGSNHVLLKGKHEWTGTYDATTGKLDVTRNLSEDEIQQQEAKYRVPQWARDLVARQPIRQELVLSVQNAADGRLSMTGDVYGKKIVWEEYVDSDTGEPDLRTRKVKIVADTPARKPLGRIFATKEQVTETQIVVHLPNSPLAKSSVTSLTKLEMFDVDLTLSCDVPERGRSTLRVELTNDRTGKSTSLPLDAFSSRPESSGARIYHNEIPLNLATGGGTTYSHIGFDLLTSGASALETNNGDTVTFAYQKKAKVQITVYDGDLQRQIGQDIAMLRDAEQLLGWAILQKPKAGQEGLDRKRRVITDCFQMLDYPEDNLSYDVKSLIWIRKRFIADACINLVSQDPSKWTRLPNGQHIDGYVESESAFGLTAYSVEEADALSRAVEQSRQYASAAANTLVRETTNLAVSTAVGMTPHSLLSVVFLGHDLMGNPVGTNERVNAAFWLLLGLVGPKAIEARLNLDTPIPARGIDAFKPEAEGGTTVATGGKPGPTIKVGADTPNATGTTATSDTTATSGAGGAKSSTNITSDTTVAGGIKPAVKTESVPQTVGVASDASAPGGRASANAKASTEGGSSTRGSSGAEKGNTKPRESGGGQGRGNSGGDTGGGGGQGEGWPGEGSSQPLQPDPYKAEIQPVPPGTDVAHNVIVKRLNEETGKWEDRTDFDAVRHVKLDYDLEGNVADRWYVVEKKSAMSAKDPDAWIRDELIPKLDNYQEALTGERKLLPAELRDNPESVAIGVEFEETPQPQFKAKVTEAVNKWRAEHQGRTVRLTFPD